MVNSFFKDNSSDTSDIISASDCLNALSELEKRELFDNKMEIEFTAGETIIKKGFTVSNILYLESGLAKLDVVTDKHTSTVSLVPPNSFVGVICTFASHNFDFNAIALENTIIYSFDIKLFEKFVHQNGKFACHLIKHMSGLTKTLIHKIARLNHKNIDGALSILLLEFSNIFNANSFTLPVNRIELANMLGYSKESVINTLSKFNKEGIIKVNEKKIKINDKKRLEQIGEIG